MHEITFIQGFLLALLAFVVGMDFYLEVFFWFRPIIVGTLTGLILGDVQTGVIGGGIAELAFAGLTPAGGSQPPNPILAGLMTPVISFTTGLNAVQSLALALPFSFLMQYVVLMFWSTYSFLMPKLDEYAKKSETKKFIMLNVLSLVFVGLVYAIVVFLSAYLAQNSMREIVSKMPEWLAHGFSIIGGVLPAIGFAMLLKIMLKGWLVPYLLFGLIFALFIPYNNLLPLAVIACGLGIIEFNKKNNPNQVDLNGGNSNDGI